MDCCKIEIEGLEVLLKKSQRARRVSIKIKPFEGVCVSVPHRMSFKKAQEFAFQHSDWILKNHLKVQKQEQSLTRFDETTNFSTRHHKLFIEKTDKSSASARIIKDKILIKFPLPEDISTPQNQKFIRDTLVKAWRKEAKEYLPKRTEELAQKHSLKYNDIKIKNLKSRWGSCSSKNNINLSLHLMKLPDELVDYVILHELAHIIHKNHSKNFWNCLETICPKSKYLNKQLREHQIEIY